MLYREFCIKRGYLAAFFFSHSSTWEREMVSLRLPNRTSSNGTAPLMVLRILVPVKMHNPDE
jgi:hypothetical protein